MTIQEFIAELGRVHDQFDWMFLVDQSHGSERRMQPRMHLRAIPRGASIGTGLDPIGAVCYARSGKVYRPDAWADGAETLELLPAVSGVLLAATNDRTWTGPEGSRQPVPELIELRKLLIETVGLSVSETA